MSAPYPLPTNFSITPAGLLSWANTVTGGIFGLFCVLLTLVAIIFWEMRAGWTLKSSLMPAAGVSLLVGLVLYWLGALQSYVLLLLVFLIGFSWMWDR